MPKPWDLFATKAFEFPTDTVEKQRLGEVLSRCLAKKPWERYAAAEQLQADLIPAIRAIQTIPGVERSSESELTERLTN